MCIDRYLLYTIAAAVRTNGVILYYTAVTTCTYLTSSNVRKRQVPITAVVMKRVRPICGGKLQLVPF